jgi:hypothetical protein
MSLFMVERYMPGVKPETVKRAAGRIAMELGTSPEGTPPPVRHLTCMYVPSDETVLCTFSGPSAEAIEELNRRARFPFDHIVEVRELSIEANVRATHSPLRSEGKLQGNP